MAYFSLPARYFKELAPVDTSNIIVCFTCKRDMQKCHRLRIAAQYGFDLKGKNGDSNCCNQRLEKPNLIVGPVIFALILLMLNYGVCQSEISKAKYQ